MAHTLVPSTRVRLALQALQRDRWAWLAARYALAVLLVALALGLKQLLAPLGGRSLLDLFIPAVMMSAWLGGLGPGLLAALLSILAINYFLLPPLGSSSMFFPSDLLALAIFVLVAGLVAWLTLSQRATSQSLARMLERMSDAFIGLDREARFTYVNAHAEHLLGRTRAELLGRRVWEVLPELEGGPLAGALRQAAHQQKAVTLEDYSPALRRWVEVVAYPGQDGVSLFFQDITERKQAEREREELLQREQAARAQAEEAVQAREAFLATVTHDLRTPLTSIRGTAQLLRRRAERQAGGIEPGQLMEGLGTIEQSSTRIAALLGELLDAARLEAGQSLPLQRQPHDLLELVRQIAAGHAQEAGHERVEVVAQTEAVVGTWDATRLERVLDNLLENALKYSPADSRVTLRVAQEGKWAILQVQDHGMGIPPADLPHIFERFQRGSNVQGSAQGTGLGLWGVRQIVEAHGGNIQIDSQEGRGTVVTVRLPL